MTHLHMEFFFGSSSDNFFRHFVIMLETQQTPFKWTENGEAGKVTCTDASYLPQASFLPHPHPDARLTPGTILPHPLALLPVKFLLDRGRVLRHYWSYFNSGLNTGTLGKMYCQDIKVKDENFVLLHVIAHYNQLIDKWKKPKAFHVPAQYPLVQGRIQGSTIQVLLPQSYRKFKHLEKSLISFQRSFIEYVRQNWHSNTRSIITNAVSKISL